MLDPDRIPTFSIRILRGNIVSEGYLRQITIIKLAPMSADQPVSCILRVRLLCSPLALARPSRVNIPTDPISFVKNLIWCGRWRAMNAPCGMFLHSGETYLQILVVPINSRASTNGLCPKRNKGGMSYLCYNDPHCWLLKKMILFLYRKI